MNSTAAKSRARTSFGTIIISRGTITKILYEMQFVLQGIAILLLLLQGCDAFTRTFLRTSDTSALKLVNIRISCLLKMSGDQGSGEIGKKRELEETEFQAKLKIANAAAELSMKREREAAEALAMSLKPVVVPKLSVLDGKFEKTIEPKSGFTEKQGAFDYGLLIAFPVMIGTLGFFLFFPYLAPIFAGNSGVPL